jgi:hypothetical protein
VLEEIVQVAATCLLQSWQRDYAEAKFQRDAVSEEEWDKLRRPQTGLEDDAPLRPIVAVRNEEMTAGRERRPHAIEQGISLSSRVNVLIRLFAFTWP